ncbi:hypothetical protein NEOC84_001983|nr:Uncharacterized protein [Neochlamydia sp. AcF95]NGY96049.1 hypothetical protein [Neochlamydia sp. AcF84]
MMVHSIGYSAPCLIKTILPESQIANVLTADVSFNEEKKKDKIYLMDIKEKESAPLN